jgi:HlyD family secretion protein
MRVRITAAALVVLAAACSGQNGGYSGTVQTESIAVGSQVGGRVVEVDVAAGSRVHRGSIVLRLDPAILQAQYDQAVAQANQAGEHLTELQNGNIESDVDRANAQSSAAQAQYQQAVAQSAPQAEAGEAAVSDAEAGLSLAQSNVKRARSLASTGDVSKQVLDQAESQYAAAQARVAQAKATYAALSQAQLPGQRATAEQNAAAQSAAAQTVREGPRPEVISQARSAADAARASAARAKTQLLEADIVSTADGVVESFDLHPGDLLQPNQPAAVIDTFADPYVYVYASQKDLARFSSGAKMRVSSDSGLGTFDGVVETHDRTAQFTPQNVETADQRAELVYGVKIRIHDPEHKLLSGTTVTVYPQ